MFIYKEWDNFCDILRKNNILSVTAENQHEEKSSKFLILKHDVETNVKKAYKLSCIESKYGHSGVYYVQAYLMKDKKEEKRVFYEVKKKLAFKSRVLEYAVYCSTHEC